MAFCRPRFPAEQALRIELKVASNLMTMIMRMMSGFHERRDSWLWNATVKVCAEFVAGQYDHDGTVCSCVVEKKNIYIYIYI